MVIHYGNKLWLTYSKDVSLETLRVLICSKEAFTRFEAQIQWENRFPGACYVQVQGASLSSRVPISKIITFERMADNEPDMCLLIIDKMIIDY